MIALVMSLFSTFGSALGSLGTYLVGLFIKHEADVSQAAKDEQDAMDQHAGDGQISAGEQDSAEAQLEKIKEEQLALEQKQGSITKGN